MSFRVLQGSYPSILDPKHPNCKACWTFDDVTGSVVHDSSRSGADVTMRGDSSIVAGYDGNSGRFTGNDGSYADCGPSGYTNWSSNTQGAISYWVYLPASGPGPGLCLGDSGTDFYMEFNIVSSGYLLFAVRPGIDHSYGNSYIMTRETWIHVLLNVDDTNNPEFWIDGVKDTGTPSVIVGTPAGKWWNDITGENTFRIASLARISDLYRTGDMDFIRIFDRFLTDDEIVTLANE